MSRFRNALAAIVLLLAISIMTFTPVVRSFYGERNNPSVHISSKQANSSENYFGPSLRNMSWSIIKYRQLAMPYLSEIKLQPACIILFLCSLLSFIAAVRKRATLIHPLFKNKPLRTGPAYLQHCLLLI